MRAYQASPGAALVGKSQDHSGFGFGVGEPVQWKEGSLSADKNPVMGPSEACGPRPFTDCLL